MDADGHFGVVEHGVSYDGRSPLAAVGEADSRFFVVMALVADQYRDSITCLADSGFVVLVADVVSDCWRRVCTYPDSRQLISEASIPANDW